MKSNSLINRFGLSFLFLLVISCEKVNKPDCSQFISENMKKISCNTIDLNVKSKYMIDETVKYRILSKYKVNIIRDIEPNLLDSCYYDFMRNILIEKKEIGFIDSIITEVEESTSDYEIFSGLQFHDGAYSFLLDSRLVEGNSAIINDSEGYYEVVDSLQLYFSKLNIHRLSLWITIDEKGLLEAIELTNFKCKGEISKTIYDKLRFLKWTPAEYKGDKVRYRYFETW